MTKLLDNNPTGAYTSCFFFIIILVQLEFWFVTYKKALRSFVTLIKILTYKIIYNSSAKKLKSYF